jgi:Aerotolerance regulator N-terminal
MFWRQPAAWFGLVALAVPILVHLLGRRPPTPLRFPTLRFLDVSTIVPARRHRLNDVRLLIVRLAIVAAAVCALAGPVFVAVRPASTGTIARAIVVDTSASMNLPAPDGRTAAVTARERAQSLTAGAATSRVIDGDALGPAIAAAAGWLASEAGTREIVVISDFQRGGFEATDLAPLDRETGITLVRIDSTPPLAFAGPASNVGGRLLLSQVVMDGAESRVTWMPAPAGTAAPSPLTTFAGPGEAAIAGAALEAAAAEGVPATATDRQIAIVFPGATERAAIVASAKAPDQPWMFAVINAIHQDPLLAGLSCGDRRCLEATATQTATVGGSTRLIFFTPPDASTLYTAALIRSAWRAAVPLTTLRELEPTHIADATLQQWNRQATGAASPRPDAGDRSDARWVWVAVLALLALEAWMRRTRPPATVEMERARVA